MWFSGTEWAINKQNRLSAGSLNRTLNLNTFFQNPLKLIVSFGVLMIKVTSVFGYECEKHQTKKGKRFQSKTVIFQTSIIIRYIYLVNGWYIFFELWTSKFQKLLSDVFIQPLKPNEYQLKKYIASGLEVNSILWMNRKSAFRWFNNITARAKGESNVNLI